METAKVKVTFLITVVGFFIIIFLQFEQVSLDAANPQLT